MSGVRSRAAHFRLSSTVVLIALSVVVVSCRDGATDADTPPDTADEQGPIPDVRTAVEAVGEVVDLSVSTPDGRSRSAHLYVPASLPDDPAALLVALHGGIGSGPQFEQTSGYDGLAEANGFLVVYPDGVGTGPDEDRFRTWNGGVCCGAAAARDVDDVAFLRQLVDQLSDEYAVDPERVYATGHSNGMIMSYRLVCEAADVFVAAAGQAGTLGIDGCSPSDPISLLHIHGEDDDNLPIDGGRGNGISGVDFPSPRQGIRTVAAGDGCAAEPRTTRTPPVTTETWTGCDDGTSVVFERVAGASHAWMGADAETRPGGPEPFADHDASLASWSFLATHPRRA